MAGKAALSFGGEDIDFGYRVRKAGLRVVFNEAARSYQFWAVDPAVSRPKAFSYPHGQWSPEVAAAVREAGYAVAFTVTPGVVRRGENRYAVPRIEVLESDSPRTLRLKVATAAWPDPWRRRLLRLLRTSS